MADFIYNFKKKFGSLKKRTKILIILFFILIAVLIIVPFLGLTVVCPLMSDVPRLELSINEKTDTNIIEGYNRPEESTYLTFPEWHLVYIPEEYSIWIKDKRPSEFPYFSAIGQFWTGYCNIYEITKQQYPFNIGNHFMLWVIGTSSTIEFGIKGPYEKSIGRLTEWASSYEKTGEDEFAYIFNDEYVTFLYDAPWYEFSFSDKLNELWTETDIIGPHIVRKLERRTMLSIELGTKIIYGGIIKKGTRMLYGIAPLEIYSSVENVTDDLFDELPLEKVAESDGKNSYIIKMPRYRKFTEIVPQLSRKGVRFIDIAGNDEIFLTVISPTDWHYSLDDGEPLFEMKILTNERLKRIGVRAPVKSLHKILPALENQNITIEHLYDY